jgi:hypothetical protein
MVAMACVFGIVGCSEAEPGQPAEVALEFSSLLEVLSADSLAGRRAATEDARKAARIIADQFRLAGLEAFGDSGFFQRIPLRATSRAGGRTRLTLLDSWTAFDSLAESDRRTETNVIGLVRGTDPDLASEYVVLTAHFDHVGIGRPSDGDSIYNGADDDASGVVALVEIGRALAEDPPRRSVLLAAMAAEEAGFIGTRWYLAHPGVPLDSTVAVLNLEMIGRPDTALAPGQLWLTGFERSTMGESLNAAGLPIYQDPRPGQRFYQRSDNIPFARAGIPAHTLSSFGMHQDYHSPDDEAERIDFDHLGAAIGTAARAARLIADGPFPVWHGGGRP